MSGAFFPVESVRIELTSQLPDYGLANRSFNHLGNSLGAEDARLELARAQTRQFSRLLPYQLG